MVGIPLEQVSGTVGPYSADMLYLPNFSGCGINTMIAMRSGRRYCHNWVDHQLVKEPHLDKFRHSNRTIVLVQRLHSRCEIDTPRNKTYYLPFSPLLHRQIRTHDILLAGLKENFEPLGYPVQVHRGDEGMEAHALIFSQAQFLVAPHGAGMSLMFCTR